MFELVLLLRKGILSRWKQIYAFSTTQLKKTSGLLIDYPKKQVDFKGTIVHLLKIILLFIQIVQFLSKIITQIKITF